MKNIKFRSWNGKKMLDAFWIENRTDYLGLVTHHGASDFPFMQFTGLLDKNGKEIYEGDIVKKNGLIDTVEWFDPNTGFIPFAGGCGEWESEQCEIIGNVYEKPNLLRES